MDSTTTSEILQIEIGKRIDFDLAGAHGSPSLKPHGGDYLGNARKPDKSISRKGHGDDGDDG